MHWNTVYITNVTCHNWEPYTKQIRMHDIVKMSCTLDMSVMLRGATHDVMNFMLKQTSMDPTLQCLEKYAIPCDKDALIQAWT